MTALLLRVYIQMRAGKIDESLLTERMNHELSPAELTQDKPIFDQLGDITRLTLEKREAVQGGLRYVYLVAFASAQGHLTLFVTTEGRIGGYSMAA